MSGFFTSSNGPSLQQWHRNNVRYGDRRLSADVAPQLDMSVPPRLRKAYDSVADLRDRDLTDWLNRALEARAQAAHQASQQEYAAAHEGRTLITDERPAYDAVVRGGMQPTDFDYARHLYKLDTAEREVSASEKAVKREAARQEARCRCCRALDVPTRLPIVRLTEDGTPGGLRPSPQGKVMRLDGAGVVCVECETVIAAKYRDTLAAQRLDGRRSRSDLAGDYLKHVTVPKR